MARINPDDGDYQPDQPEPPTPAPAPSAGGGGGFGHPVYDQIANTYRAISGGKYNPTYADVSQWGTNVDPTYMSKIGGAISNWWSNYQKTQPAQTPSPDQTSPATPPPTGGYDPSSGAYVPPSSPPAAGGGTSVFNDPATQAYEQQINALISRLNQPYTPPSFQPAMDYLNKYFQQLQGPAYTPAQMDLMQTQTLDPLERQHAAARQQVIERLGQRGIAPSSGIVEKALENVDNQFSTLRTQAQSGFARNAIDLSRQNAAQAAVLGPQMASLEQQLFGTNEGRALQAGNLGSIVPNLAWSRLTGASNAIQPINPGSLFGPLQQFQQFGYGQGSDFMTQLMQTLSQLFR